MSMIRHILKPFLSLVLVATLISGCGFHLRGTIELPASLTEGKIFVESTDLDLIDLLNNSLSSNNATVTDEKAGSTLLRLTKSNYRRTVRTTDASGIATGYRLRYDVDYIVISPEGEILKPVTSVRQERNIDYSASQQLQIDEEEEFLKSDMRREIVLQVMRQLSKI